MSSTSPQLDTTALAKALRGWLPDRRWFGGKGRGIRSVKVVSQTCLREGDPSLHHVLIDVSYGDGQPETYQVPVGIASTVPEHLTGVAIGPVGSGAVYDAWHNGGVPRLFRPPIAGEGKVFEIAFRRGMPRAGGEPLDTSLHGRAL